MAFISDHVAGGAAASLFSSAYYVVPLWLLSGIWMVLTNPFSMTSFVVVLPIVISAILPPYGSKTLLRSWPFSCIPTYFNYEEIKETTDEEVQELMKKRRVLFCVQPHGVFSFGGACAGVEWSKSWWSPTESPTAAANVITSIPILKHIVGIFGITDASSRGLTKTLKKKSVVLYIGGIAELFLSSENEEKLFIRKRKGFIKLALRTGVEIIPIYFLGNTTVLTVLKSSFLRKFARITGASLTAFWGRFYLPIPRAKKIVGIVGKPLGIPATPVPEPTQAQVDEWHTKYLAEVERIYEQYKGTNADYKGKELVFE
jgi:2-acylglycerol O-acyltransferase 2